MDEKYKEIRQSKSSITIGNLNTKKPLKEEETIKLVENKKEVFLSLTKKGLLPLPRPMSSNLQRFRDNGKYCITRILDMTKANARISPRS